MKLTKEHTNLLAVALIAVLVTLQISSMFRGKQPDEKLIRNEMKLERLEEKRVTDSLFHVEIIAQKDSVIALLKSKDAIIVNHYTQSNEKLKNIPAAVTSLSVQQLVQSAIDY